MMNNFFLYDSTLRDALQSPTFNPTLDEKLEIYHALNESMIDTLELGFAIQDKFDDTLLSALESSSCQKEVSILVYAQKSDVEKALQMVEKFENFRLNLYLPQEDRSQEEYKDQVMDVCYIASKNCDNLHFTAMHASKTEDDYLKEIFQVASRFGAKTLSLADTIGCANPQTITRQITNLRTLMIENNIGLHAHNSDDLADVNAFTAIECGAKVIEGTINGIGIAKGNTNILNIMREHKIEISPALEKISKKWSALANS